MLIVPSDLVVASPKASFGLPEVTVGIFAAAGGLSRLVRICGIQLASEIAMTGRRLSAEEAKSFHLINRISSSPASLIDEAVVLAKQIATLSPDAILVTRQGLREALETASVERASQITNDRWMAKLMQADNTKIGLTSFATKSKPVWAPSKL
jgi:enoyl-CoA hydratase/carnithine racemase